MYREPGKPNIPALIDPNFKGYSKAVCKWWMNGEDCIGLKQGRCHGHYQGTRHPFVVEVGLYYGTITRLYPPSKPRYGTIVEDTTRYSFTFHLLSNWAAPTTPPALNIRVRYQRKWYYASKSAATAVTPVKPCNLSGNWVFTVL